MMAAVVHAAALPADIRDALQQLKTYDADQSRKPLIAVEQFAQGASGDVEQRKALAVEFGKLLTDPATTAAARTFICQKLALVGTDAEVPLLAKWLGDPERAENARYALQGMQSAAADAAMRAALPRLSGKLLAGVVLCLGQRRDAAATNALAKLLDSSDRDVAAAATWALGRIGTAEAAAALGKAKTPGVVDALLSCAERLPDKAAAQNICRDLLAKPQPPLVRVAVVTHLARLGDDALTLLLPLMKDPDPFVCATAMRLAAQLKGAAVTPALTSELAKLDWSRQPVLLDALAQRGDKGAAEAAALLMNCGDEAVKLAAIQAVGALGNATHVAALATLASEPGPAQKAAESALARLSGSGVDEVVLKAAATGTPPMRAAMMNIVVARGMSSALPAIMAAARDPEPTVAIAAVRAAAKLGGGDVYPKLVEMLLATNNAGTRAALEGAVVVAAKHIGDPKARLEILQAGAKPDASLENKVSVLRVLAGIGGPEALAAVRGQLDAGNAMVRDAAVRALVGWQDASASNDLIQVAEKAADAKHRALALRALLRLASAEKSTSWVRKIKPLAKTADEKRQLLGALSSADDAAALEVAVGMVEDKEVSAEAGAAALKIGQQLMGAQPDTVEEAMAKVAAAPDKALAAKAKALQAQAHNARVACDRHGIERAQALSKDLPAGCRVVVYLDCGPDVGAGSAAGPRLKVAKGGPWKYTDEPAGTVAFSGSEVVIEASQLKPKTAYVLGFTWWDYDGNGRAQSVWVNGKKLVDATTLPAMRGKNQGPATVLVAIPAELAANGKLSIAFRREAASNAVVSEIWLLANTSGVAVAVTPAVTATVATDWSAPASKPKEPELTLQRTPVVRANAGAEKKVLIVTGREMHNWRQTTPVLTAALAKDKRLEISVVEDAAFLGAPELKNYDVIVLHYQNWQVPDPGAEVLANLVRCVEGGRGFVMVHFACGAFIDWPTKAVRKELLPIAGRVWNPKFRGHDPRGPFRVNVTDHKHPITAGLADFDTDDELYTCLDGDVPIQVLATAKSKVDKKDYPMAFVLSPGKGRTFHFVLGHDVKALNPAALELFRRGTAWAAGKSPTP